MIISDYMQNIRVYVGKNGKLTLGNGKTLCMIIDSYSLKTDGFKIISNFKVNFASEHYIIDDIGKILEKYKNTIILGDEISVLANAYNIFSNQTQNLGKLSRQLRKNENYLFLTAQVYNDIPANIRRLGNDVIIVEKIHPDKSICYISNNKKCPIKKHYYKEYTLDGGINNVLFPDLIYIENGEIKIKENFFYEQFNTKEIIHRRD